MGSSPIGTEKCLTHFFFIHGGIWSTLDPSGQPRLPCCPIRSSALRFPCCGLILFARNYPAEHFFYYTLILLCTCAAVPLILLCTYSYPAVPLFCCALTLLPVFCCTLTLQCPYFILHLPCSAFILFCTPYLPCHACILLRTFLPCCVFILFSLS